jgi:hypothetical protein
MASGAEYFLKKALGEDFMESLQKFELWKPGTKSTVDHEEICTALQIVPRTIISMLIKELAPMAIGENKVINLLVAENAVINITKHERDVYSGDILKDNVKIVDFKFRSIPGVGLVIMSAFELYDMENLINRPQHGQVHTHDYSDNIQKMIDERLALHDLVNQVVEKKIRQRDAVHNLLLSRITEELEKAKFEIGNARATADFAHERIGKLRDGTMDERPPKIAKTEAPKKKTRPLDEFLQKRQKKKEYSVVMAKGETVGCPDCGKNIFDGKLFSGCVCLGADMDRKVFIKKSEDGIKVRFSKGWDEENIEMLLEVLRRKHE